MHGVAWERSLGRRDDEVVFVIPRNFRFGLVGEYIYDSQQKVIPILVICLLIDVASVSTVCIIKW
jgi:hypothetical protein